MSSPFVVAVLGVVAFSQGCGGGAVHGTPSQLVRGAAARTLAAGSARVDESGPHLTRSGVAELAGTRADIVEHGPFGFREYRYVGASWFQLGGELGAVGEDLGGKWVRHPRAGAQDDVLAAVTTRIRALAHATGVRLLGGHRYSSVVDGVPEQLTLDSRGRVIALRRGGVLLRLSHFGIGVDVERPPADQLYVGHD